jgi:transcriptional regulator GlxA family with amidase domain
MLREEMARPDLGTRAVAGSIMKICLTLLFRRHLRELVESDVLVHGFEDERLKRAVACVLDQPASAHTVAGLAGTAGMSRSAFARTFSNTFHMSPMEFVAKTRLHHAAALLRGTDLPVKAIAASIGFASRSHFSRAFRAAYGSGPKSFRHHSLNAPTGAPRTLYGDRDKYALSDEPPEV